MTRVCVGLNGGCSGHIESEMLHCFCLSEAVISATQRWDRRWKEIRAFKGKVDPCMSLTDARDENRDEENVRYEGSKHYRKGRCNVRLREKIVLWPFFEFKTFFSKQMRTVLSQQSFTFLGKYSTGCNSLCQKRKTSPCNNMQKRMVLDSRIQTANHKKILKRHITLAHKYVFLFARVPVRARCPRKPLEKLSQETNVKRKERLALCQATA